MVILFIMALASGSLGNDGAEDHDDYDDDIDFANDLDGLRQNGCGNVSIGCVCSAIQNGCDFRIDTCGRIAINAK